MSITDHFKPSDNVVCDDLENDLFPLLHQPWTPDCRGGGRMIGLQPANKLAPKMCPVNGPLSPA